MAIRVSTPEGISIEFPDGTDQQTIARVMSQAGGGAGKFAAPAVKDAKPPVSAGEMAEDVARSAGIGVAQGAIGLATLPGNLEALGRAGINAGAGLVGVKPPVAPETILPTYNDWKGRIEGYTGEFYKPKTTAGEYARTIGEFAPLGVAGAGSAASKAARVLAPAVTSETAGQLTAGTSAEPWARVAGAIVGGSVPNMTARLITPAPADASRASAVKALEKEGVTAITAGQRTGNERVRWLEDATAMIPGGGGKATAMQNMANEQFSRAVLKRAGVQADRATQEVLDDAFDAIGREYETFAVLSAVKSIQPSRAAALSAQRSATSYNYSVPVSERIPRVQVLADEISQKMAIGMDVAKWQSYRSSLRKVQRELVGDPYASKAIGKLIETMDRQLVVSAPKAERGKILEGLRDRNRRYKNLLAIEIAATRAGEAASSGILTPAAMRGAVTNTKQARRNYARGRGDLDKLVRSANQVITPLRSSGTAERSMAQGFISAPGAVIGGIGGGSVEGAIIGTVAPWAAKAVTARGLMSRPVQNYLANQRIPYQIEGNRLMSLPALPYILERED